jgi:hypothetical protein
MAGHKPLIMTKVQKNVFILQKISPLYNIRKLKVLIHRMGFQTMDKAQKPINSVCYTPSSEPYRI